MKLIELIKKNEALKILTVFIFSLLVNSFVIFLLLKIFRFPGDPELFLELLWYAELLWIVPYIAFYKPFLGLCAALFIEISIRKFHVGPVSIRTIILLLLAALFIGNEIFIKKRKLIRFTDFLKDPIIRFSVLFFLWHVFVFTVFHRKEFSLNQTVRMFVGILILILCTSFLDNRKKISIFISLGIIMLFLSAVVAILQKYVGEPFISLPGMLGEHDFSWQLHYLSMERYSGLTGEALGLNYDIVNILPLLLSITFFNVLRKKIIEGKYILLSLASLVILYALVLTGTRSGFYGIFIGLCFTVFFIGIKNKKLFFRIVKPLSVFFLIILLFAAAANISGIHSFSRLKEFKDVSTLSKMSRFIAGINASKKALLFGTGSSVVEDVKEDQIPPFLRKLLPGTHGGYAHNIFINNLLIGGLPQLFLLIILFSLIITNTFSVLSKIISDKKKLPYFFFYAGYSIWIIAYVCDKFFHNSSPFNSDLLFWYILGSLLALTNLFKKEKSPDPAVC